MTPHRAAEFGLAGDLGRPHPCDLFKNAQKIVSAIPSQRSMHNSSCKITDYYKFTFPDSDGPKTKAPRTGKQENTWIAASE
jgi:hypothetical protein